MKTLLSLNKITLVCSFLLLFCASILRGQVKPYDILISEIMARPNSSNSPNAEFIELYNRSNQPIQLDSFKLINGSVINIIPKGSKINKYLIIYKKKQGITFKSFGDTLAIDSLSSLGNITDKFYLTDKNGKVIDAVDYNKFDYGNAQKSQGGYSLERINVNAPCDFNNWIGSKDLGGTPGKQNSVYKIGIDSMPQIEHYHLDGNMLEIEFDRSMRRVNISDTSKYFNTNKGLKINDLSFKIPFYNVLSIQLGGTFKDNVSYTFFIKSSYTNCDTISPINISKEYALSIKKPDSAKVGDIVINEVLTNPTTGGFRYIELLNKSNKVIDAASLMISDSIQNRSFVGHFLLFPDSFLVLTDNPKFVQNFYKTSHLKMSYLAYKLPTWDEKKGQIRINTNLDTAKKKIITLDLLDYTKSFHNPLLQNTEGVSLERINPNKPNDKSNWQSAATKYYGTPGYINSQFHLDNPLISKDSLAIFTIDKPTFIADGLPENYLKLHYELDKTGAFAKILIFDIKGHLVKKWMDNEPLATKGDILWNGETDENITAPIGIYIVYIELIMPTGSIQTFKKMISLTTRL
jgi:Lamin Tail Domain